MIAHLLQQQGMHVKPYLELMIMKKLYQDHYERKISQKVVKNWVNKELEKLPGPSIVDLKKPPTVMPLFK